MCGCNWRPATGASPDAGSPSVEPLAIACRADREEVDCADSANHVEFSPAHRNNYA